MGDAYPELRHEAEKIESEIKAEEERFEETLARGLERFEELADQPAISAEDAFTLAATYGFPIELTVELAEERGQPVDVDGYRELMAEHREVSRGAVAESVRAIEGARKRVRRLREDGGAHGDRGAGAGRGRPLPRQAPRVAVLRRGRRPGLGRRLHRAPGDRRARRARRRGTSRRRPDAALRGRGLRRRRPRARGRVVEPPLPDDGEPHGDPPPAQGSPGSPRRPRAAGGIGRTPGQAPLRLHARAGAERRRARRRRAAGEREGLREPPRARVRRAARGGEEAGRDDALRREVRGRRTRDRDPRLLDGALRRHPRHEDRGDRPVRDPFRGLRGLRRAADRSHHRWRGVRVPAEPLARARPAEGASSSACARRSRRRRAPRSRMSRPT